MAIKEKQVDKERKKKVNEKKEEGQRLVNIYGEKKNIDKECGGGGMWWVGVNNEEKKIILGNAIWTSHCSLNEPSVSRA